MRKLAACVRVVACALALGAAVAMAGRALASPPEYTSKLSPHGIWLDSSRYGRVWQPFVAKPGWNPYYDGHWEYTDVGHTWVSDYSWGAIAYHYGTWAVEPGRGWVWIPGNIWAPSWVVFRSGPDFIGWAPVAPEFVVGGVIVSGPDYDASFVFVPSRQFFAPRVRTCALPPSQTTVIVTKTKIVQKSFQIENQVVVNRGPSLEELRRVTGRPVRVVRLESVKGMGADVRREARFDEWRVRNGVHASEPKVAWMPRGAAVSKTSASNEYDARGDAQRSDEPRRSAPSGMESQGRGATHESVHGSVTESARGTVAEKTVYDETARPGAARVAHQDEVVDERPSRVSEGSHGSAGSRGSANGETQSDRDVKLLASREKEARGRARTVEKPVRPKTSS